MGKQKHVKKEKATEDEFSLDEVLYLGGTKDDYNLLSSITDGDATEPTGKAKGDTVKEDELREFIKSLEFDKVQAQTVVSDHDEEDDSKETEQHPVKKEKVTKKAEEPKESSKTKGKKSKNKYKTVQDNEVSSTNADIDVEEQDFTKSGLLVKPGSWYSHEFPNDPVEFPEPTEKAFLRLKNLSIKIMNDQTDLYRRLQEKKSKSAGSEAAWLRTVLTSGTIADKMAALTLLVQESPVYNLHALENLVSMAEKKGKRQAIQASEALKELFMSELLLDDRKLRTFEQHPLAKLNDITSGNRDSRNKRLLLWHYEARLKIVYSRYLDTLEKLCQDTLHSTKQKALNILCALLSSKPEQEKRLLAVVVNKLGDPDYHIASKASYLLSQLVKQHPNMKVVIFLEVERLLYRPNISKKAQYYGVCFLQGMLLSRGDQDLAARLLTTYFSFFQMHVKQGEVDSKMLRALLTGVNRVYPFVTKEEKGKLTEQIDMLYRVVHMVHFNTSLQALSLLYQVIDTEDSTADRFYMALYRKILDPALRSSAHQPLFLNLLFKAFMKDTTLERIKAFVKRLLQVCCHMPPTFICGALLLVSEVVKSKGAVLTLKRVGLGAVEESDDEEEHFMDAQEEEEAGEGEDRVTDKMTAYDKKMNSTSWVHRKHKMGGSGEYDPHQRNPLHCHADRECVWELAQLALHYHPSVALFANTLLEGKSISYSGNPLLDFNRMRFLDRFVYRNPKKIVSETDGMVSKKRLYVPKGVRAIPVNSDKYLLSGADKIPVDEKFFYQFFTEHRKQTEDDSDEGSISDDEFDDYLDKFEAGLEDKEMDIDFAEEAFKGQGQTEVSEESDEDPDFSDLPSDSEDEDLKRQFDEEMADVDEEFELSDEDDEDEFSDEDEFDSPTTKSGKRAAMEDDYFPDKHKQKRKKNEDISSLFAAADDFSHLLEETGGMKYDMGTSDAVAVKSDKDAKQLSWESRQWHDKHQHKQKPQNRGSKSRSSGVQRRVGKKAKSKPAKHRR